MIVPIVDICVIVGHHCLNFLLNFTFSKLEVNMCNIGLMDLLWLKKQQHLFEVKMQLPLVRTIKGREEVKVVDLWQTAQHHWCQFTSRCPPQVGCRISSHCQVFYWWICSSPDSHLKCLRFQSSTHGQMFHWPFCYNCPVFHWYGSWIYNDLCNHCEF